jgi:hypothetical protein
MVLGMKEPAEFARQVEEHPAAPAGRLRACRRLSFGSDDGGV